MRARLINAGLVVAFTVLLFGGRLDERRAGGGWQPLGSVWADYSGDQWFALSKHVAACRLCCLEGVVIVNTLLVKRAATNALEEISVSRKLLPGAAEEIGLETNTLATYIGLGLDGGGRCAVFIR